MTLRTSLNSINPTLNMVRFTIRKNIGLLLLSVVAVLMLCPGFYLVRMEDYATYSIDLVWVLAAIITVCAGVLSIFYNVINFMFLYSKKSSDVFHALPLTRMQLLFSRYLAGVISTLIPVIVGYLSLVIIFACMPLHRPDIGMVFGCMAYTVMTVLVCSAFSMVFIVCAGSAFDLVLSFLGLNGGLLVAGLVVTSMMSSLLVGAADEINYKMFEWLSPFWYCGAGLVRFIDNDCVFYSDSLHYFIRTAVYTVVFLGVSLVLYDRRKAEKGGDAYAYRFIYILTSFVAGVSVSYFVGYVFQYDNYNVVFWLFAALGGGMFAVAFGAITDRGFKYFRRSLIVGGCSVTVLFLLGVIFMTGAFGYSSRIPEKMSIESVTVKYHGDEVIYTDPELPLSVHTAFIENKDVLIKEQRENYHYLETQYVRFDYSLKNGMKMTRQYEVPIEKFDEQLFALYSSEERLDMIENDLKESGSKTVDFDVTVDKKTKKYTFKRGDDVEYIDTFITAKEFEEIFRIYRNELKNADKSSIISGGENLGFFWDDTRKDFKYNGYYYYLSIDNNFKDTVAYIDSLDLYERQTELEEKYDIKE